MAKEQVYGVFQSVAEQYDAANDRISFGMHHRWKQPLVEAALSGISSAGGSVLDVCCGTGDITEKIAHVRDDVKVTGLDFSSRMLDVARHRTAGLTNVTLVEGDAMALPFEDGTFDSAVISFGLRNTPDYARVIGEMVRVVRPGGVVACLDASVPDNPLVRPFYRLYYRNVMPVLGGGREKRDEYRWLYQSTQEFLRKDELTALFREAGLNPVSMKSFMCGAAALHVGKVPVTQYP